MTEATVLRVARRTGRGESLTRAQRFTCLVGLVGMLGIVSPVLAQSTTKQPPNANVDVDLRALETLSRSQAPVAPPILTRPGAPRPAEPAPTVTPVDVPKVPELAPPAAAPKPQSATAKPKPDAKKEQKKTAGSATTPAPGAPTEANTKPSAPIAASTAVPTPPTPTLPAPPTAGPSTAGPSISTPVAAIPSPTKAPAPTNSTVPAVSVPIPPAAVATAATASAATVAPLAASPAAVDAAAPPEPPTTTERPSAAAAGIVEAPPATPAPTSAPVPAPTATAAVQPSAPIPPATASPTQGRPNVATAVARIVFATEATDLPAEAAATLDGVLPALTANERLRVQVIGFAASGADISQARRVSLARALAVRSYLVDRGIKSTRVDVRPLGGRPDDGPADRVDLAVVER